MISTINSLKCTTFSLTGIRLKACLLNHNYITDIPPLSGSQTMGKFHSSERLYSQYYLFSRHQSKVTESYSGSETVANSPKKSKMAIQKYIFTSCLHSIQIFYVCMKHPCINIINLLSDHKSVSEMGPMQK